MKSDTEHGPVLVLLNSLNIGGSERKTVRMVNELHSRGCAIHLAYLNPPTTLLSEISRGVPTIGLGRQGKLSFSAIRSLKAYVLRERISRILCINLYPLIYASAVYGLFRRKNRPHVILAVNSTGRVGLKEKLASRIYSPLIRRVQTIIFGSKVQLQIWTARYKLEKSNCTVIYNGVDDEAFSPSAFACRAPTDTNFDRCNTDFVIGTVGQLRPVKNQLELISVFARLKDDFPNAKLVIVGDGPQRYSLEQAAREFGLSSRVLFVGEVVDVRPILSTMDVFVLPSISETFSNAALEAMAMGKPVILTELGGAREMVQHGADGYIYQQGNLDELSALIRKLATEPATKIAIGNCARETILQRFSFKQMASEYQRILRCNILGV